MHEMKKIFLEKKNHRIHLRISGFGLSACYHSKCDYFLFVCVRQMFLLIRLERNEEKGLWNCNMFWCLFFNDQFIITKTNFCLLYLWILVFWGYHKQGSCQAGLSAAITKVNILFIPMSTNHRFISISRLIMALHTIAYSV